VIDGDSEGGDCDEVICTVVTSHSIVSLSLHVSLNSLPTLIFAVL